MVTTAEQKAVNAGPANAPRNHNNNNGNGNSGNGGNNNGGGGNNPPPVTPPVVSTGAQVVAGKPNANSPDQINVHDYAGQIVNDPSLFMTPDMLAENHLQRMNTDAGLIDPNAAWAKPLDPNAYDVNADKVKSVNAQDANTYNVKTAQQTVGQNTMTGADGTLSAGSMVDPAQADMQGLGTGVNQDGSINYAGEALKKYAAQDMSNIIDTSTMAGKLLAQQLGEGNYTDSKATLKGQLDILQGEFIDPNTGEPRIPSWAASTARNVSKIAAFKGMTGSAATAAMSQALLEASIPIAQSDAQFFQTLTLQNLSNRQQSVINTANTLAKFEQTNVDNRMAAAIQNSKAFIEMDMKNLDNDQQAKVLNNQAMIQSILEDSKQENAKRLFVADSQNDMDKYYDNLNAQISQFNSSQSLDADKFNSNLSDSREKFYKEMQYNINVANAKWRQAVEIQEDTQQYEAASQDVKNMYDIGVNQLNQIWDRSDSLLDYAWQSSEKAKDRKSAIALAVLQGQIQSDLADQQAFGSLTAIGLTAALDPKSGIMSGLMGIFG